MPMRMRFSRVDDDLLPKANGASAKSSEETPDTVDLRGVVQRMRAIAGPDITAFQQSYAAGNTADGYEDDDPAELETPAPVYERRTDELARAAAPAAMAPPPASRDASPMEPYRPDMLPRPPREPLRPAATVREPASADPSRDRYEPRQAAQPSYRAAEPQPPAPPQPFSTQPAATPGPRREPGLSLRESILKKPLSSLYKKD